MKLWPKQAEQIGEVRLAFREHQAVVMQSPTGSGKTQMGTHAVKNASEKGNGVIWLCHRKELLEQTSKTFHKAGVHHSLLASGHHHNPRLLATIASVGSSSQCPCVITSSIRYLVVVGSTRPESRLMIIRPRPSAIRLRCVQMRARASSQAPAVNAFFGVFGGGAAAAEALGVRSG